MNQTERLKEIRERCDKATPGPWDTKKDGTIYSKADEVNPIIAETEYYYDDDSAQLCINTDDEEFILHARQDVSFLLDLVERLQNERDAVMNYLAISNCCGVCKHIGSNYQHLAGVCDKWFPAKEDKHSCGAVHGMARITGK